MTDRSSSVWALLVVVLLLAAAATVSAGEPRPWRDATEKHTVVATLVKQEGDVVKLRTAEGRLLTISRDKLSAGDREYLATLLIQNPFAAPGTSDAGIKSSSAVVVVHATMGTQEMFSQGVVFLTRQDMTYVLTNTPRFLVDQEWLVPDEVTIVHETPAGAARVSAKRLITYDDKLKAVYAAPAAQLPPVPAIATPPEVFPAAVRVSGIRIDPDAVPPSYERIDLPATLLGVSRDKNGPPMILSGRAEGLQDVNNALLIDANDRVLGLVAVGQRDKSEPKGPDRWTFQALAFARVPDRLRPAIVAGCQAVPVAGDRQETEYELVVYVADPVHQLHTPLLRAYPAEASRPSGMAPSDQGLLEKPFTVQLKAGPPSEAARPYVVNHEQLAANATVYTGRLTRKHGGVVLPHAFNVQLVGKDERGTEQFFGWTKATFEFTVAPGQAGQFPNIPGVDGIPIDMPRPVKLPEGGWRLTSDTTRITNQPPASRAEEWPQAEVSGIKLAGEVKGVGPGYGIVELKLDNTGEPGSMFRGPATFSADGAWLYYVDKDQCLHKISTSSFKSERILKLGGVCDRISIGRAGLITPLAKANTAWVIDPETLAVRRAIQSPGLRLAVGSPGSDIGFLFGSPEDPAARATIKELKMVDFSTGKVLHVVKDMYRSSENTFYLGVDKGALFHDFVFCMRMTVDGKYLFVADKVITRFRVEGTDLVYEERSPVVVSNRTTHTSLSGDGRWIAVATGGGGYSIDVFEAMKLDGARVNLPTGPYPSAVAFDPPTQNMFASNRRQIIAFGPRGGKLSEFTPGDHGVGYLLMHPKGGRFAVFSDTKVYYCDTLEDRLHDGLSRAAP